jgi:hypothetical protein
MEGDGLILAHARAVPPVHCVDVKLGTPGYPPSQFVVADFFTPMEEGENRIADKSDDGSPSLGGVR